MYIFVQPIKRPAAGQNVRKKIILDLWILGFPEQQNRQFCPGFRGRKPRGEQEHGLHTFVCADCLFFHYGLWRLAVPVVLMETAGSALFYCYTIMNDNMNRPNLFRIATSELSQDAFLVWLIQWADPSTMQYDPALCTAGQDFIRLLGLVDKIHDGTRINIS